MSEVNRGGRPRLEPTSVKTLRFPDRIWKLVRKASKDFRSVNEYLRFLVEKDIGKDNNDLLLNKTLIDSYVYFMKAGNLVKIGFTNNVNQRRNNLQNSCNEKLKVLYYYKGGTVEEKKLHKKFDKYKVDGEWFLYSNEIKDFINDKLGVINDYV